jgi:hypothetical protein
MTRQYSSTSNATTLASSINTTVTTLTVATGTGTALMGGVTLAGGNVDIFTIAIDPDTVNEEIVYVTQRSGDTLTISRGQAGTGSPGVSGISHTSGAAVKHVLTSDDLIFFRNNASPVASFAFSGSTSGTTTVQATAVAGTNTLTLPATSSDTLVGKATTDTLTNKTLTTPIIASISNSGTITVPTGTDTLVGRTTTDTLTNKTLSSGILTGTLTAGGGVGTSGQVLASTGTGVQWSTTGAGYSAPTLGSTVIPSATTVTTVAGLTLTSPTINDPKLNLTLNANVATTYTFVLTDNGKLVTSNNASAQTLSIPTNASVAFPIGTQINVAWITGAGQPTINAVTSGTTTVLSTGATSTAPKLRVANSVATCIKIATDTWLVTGDVS